MSINPYGSLTAARLAQFEETLGFSLPADYREFLLRRNGGKFQGSVVKVTGLDAKVALDEFFGLDLDERLNLELWNYQYSYKKPAGSLVIGADPGGGMVLLGLDPGWSGVYYWDYSQWFEKSTPEHNIYLMAESFTKLMEALK